MSSKLKGVKLAPMREVIYIEVFVDSVQIISSYEKALLQDIAKHASVGLATVDRVLNERGGVSHSI